MGGIGNKKGIDGTEVTVDLISLAEKLIEKIDLECLWFHTFNNMKYILQLTKFFIHFNIIFTIYSKTNVNDGGIGERVIIGIWSSNPTGRCRCDSCLSTIVWLFSLCHEVLLPHSQTLLSSNKYRHQQVTFS